MGLRHSTGSASRSVIAIPIVAVLLLAAGCNSGPKAPALENGPVFYDSQAGFRFVVPEGWTQFVHAIVPPGKLEDERMIVEYRLTTTEKPARFAVTCADVEPSVELAGYLASHLPAAEQWKQKGLSSTEQIHGTPAVRMTFVSSAAGKGEMRREVTIFRRGQRIYVFTGTFATSDRAARDQIAQAVNSTLWS